MPANQDLVISYLSNVQIIRINRPAKKNAIRPQTYDELIEALQSAEKNDSVSLTVITGTGDYFSSGNDFGVSSNQDVDLEKNLGKVRDFISTLIDYSKPLVAVVNGPAIGIGTTLLGLCDIVYASKTATFQTPFTSLGLSAEGCSTYTFPRIFGPSISSQLLYFNQSLTAQEAKDFGFVAKVYNSADLTNIFAQLKEWSQLPAKSVICTKQLMRQQHKKALHEANNMEIECLFERVQSDDFTNAMIKFIMEKKKQKL